MRLRYVLFQLLFYSTFYLLFNFSTFHFSTSVLAHHSVLPFDGARSTTVEGTVARVLWQNPHTLIAVDVESVRWTIESEASVVLKRLGWTEKLIKTGDRITVTGARAKDGRPLMRCKVITLADGREVPCFP
jgi:hypothetical protein